MPKKSRRTPALPTAADLCTGRVRLDCAEVIALIHRVNPTDRRMTDAERQARYIEKSALQSWLITQWPDHIDVRPDPAHGEDVVTLTHRLSGRDAGHAVRSHLSADARTVLDERSAPASTVRPTEASTPRPATVDPLAEAKRLLDAWDYPGAAAAFAANFDVVGLEAVLGWLEVAVDTLGWDARALDVSRLWSEPVRAHPDVARRLAKAALRCGDLEQARSFLPVLARSDATEVRAALFQQALAAGEVEQAVRLLIAIEAEPATQQQAQDLRARLVAHRREAQRPHEGPLRQAIEAGVLDDIEGEANDLLTRFPDNATAKAALRRVRDERRAQRRDRALRQAERRAARGDLAGAIRALDRASDAGAQVHEQRSAWSRALSERQRLDRIDAVCDALNSGIGLADYARLEPQDRDAVRDRVPQRALGAVEAALADRASPEDAAAFAHTVNQARTALYEGDPVDAVTLLERERTTPRWPEARELLASARAVVRQHHVLRVDEWLDEADAARKAGDASRAQRAVNRATDPDPNQVSRLQALQGWLNQAHAEAAKVRTFQSLLDAGRPVAARELAWSAAQGPHPEGWARRWFAADRAVCEALGLVWRGPSAAFEPGIGQLISQSAQAPRWQRPDGSWVIPMREEVAGEKQRLTLLFIHSDVLLESVALWCPSDPGNLTMVMGDRVIAIDSHGDAVVLDCARRRVVWTGSFAGADGYAYTVRVGDHLWVSQLSSTRGRSIRRFDPATLTWSPVESDVVAGLSDGRGGTWVMHENGAWYPGDARGRRTGRKLGRCNGVAAVTVDPVAHDAIVYIEYGDEGGLELQRHVRGRRKRWISILQGLHPQLPCQLIGDRGSQCLFLGATFTGQEQVVCWQWQDSQRYVEVWRTAVAPGSLLVSGTDGIWLVPGGPLHRFEALGPQPPAAPFGYSTPSQAHTPSVPVVDEPIQLHGRLRLSEQGDALRVELDLVYRAYEGPNGSVPPEGRTAPDDPHWVAFDDLGQFARRTDEEALYARCFAEEVGPPDNPDHPSRLLDPDDAVAFLIDSLPDLRDRWTIVGEERLIRFRSVGRAVPRVSLDERTGLFHASFQVGERTLDPDVALMAWLSGRQTVAFDDGALALLPRAWMNRHATTLADLRRLQALGPLPSHAVFDAERLAGHPAPPSTRTLPAGFRARLRPYQAEGFAWLAARRDRGVGACLADDMGLGKTVQALALIADTIQAPKYPGTPMLIVAPASVLSAWLDDLARFTPGLHRRVVVHHGADRSTEPYAGQTLVLTTYGTLRTDQALLTATEWCVVVVDEAQRIKNPASAAHRACVALRARHRLALSGTPVENDLVELWSVFQFVQPGLLGPLNELKRQVREHTDDVAAATALRARVQPFLLRRTKAQVARDLPPRQVRVVRFALSEPERNVYDRLVTSARALLDERPARAGAALSALTRLRQACCHLALLDNPELPDVDSAKLAVLDGVLERARASGHRTLVFSQWTALLRRVSDRLERSGQTPLYLDGDVPVADRGKLVDQWNAPDGPHVFLISLRAGGTGLTLTAADHVVLLEPWWNPAVEDQAIDRAHRIGQDRPVLIHRLIAEDTIEEQMMALQHKKRAVVRAALGDEGPLDDTDLQGLLALLS